MGSSVHAVVDADLRGARFSGADDPDRVATDFGVNDELDAARRGRTPEDEPVFVRGRIVPEVDAAGVFETGRGFFETDAMFAAMLYRCMVPASDTSSEAAAVQTEIHRRLGAAGRFRLAIEMSELSRSLAAAGLRARRPDLDDAGAAIELIRQLYGVALGRR